MIPSSAQVAGLLIIWLFASGCGGASSISPTAATPTPAVTPAGSNQWTVFGGFELESATLLQDLARGIVNPSNFLIVECRLNSAVQNRMTFDPSTALPVSINCTAPQSMPSGLHTLAIRVVSQTRSPNTYVFRGTVFANRGTSTITLGCPSGSRSLQNGEDVSCSFTLP